MEMMVALETTVNKDWIHGEFPIEYLGLPLFLKNGS